MAGLKPGRGGRESKEKQGKSDVHMHENALPSALSQRRSMALQGRWSKNHIDGVGSGGCFNFWSG